MAEQQNIPTFKLVLVGDGGTGKVKLKYGAVTDDRQRLSRDILQASLRRSTLLLLVLKVLSHRSQVGNGG